MSIIEPVSNKMQKNDLFKIYRSQNKFSFIGHLYFGFYILLLFVYYFLDLFDYPFQTVSYTTSFDLAVIYVKFSLFILFTLMTFVNIILIPVLAYQFIKEYSSNTKEVKIQNYHIKIGIILTIFLLIIPLLNFIYKNFILLNNIDSYVRQMILAQEFLFALQQSIPIIIIAVIIYKLVKSYPELTTAQYLVIVGITFINSFIFYYILPIITQFLTQFIGTILPQTTTLGIITTTINPTSLTQELGVISMLLVYIAYILALNLAIDVCFSLLAYKIYSFSLQPNKSHVGRMLLGYTAIAILAYIIMSIMLPEFGFLYELWQPLSLEGLVLTLVDILPDLQIGFYSIGFVISLGILLSFSNKTTIDQEKLL